MKNRIVLYAATLPALLLITGCGENTTTPPAPTVSAPAPEPDAKGKREKDPKAMLGPEGVVQ